MARRSPKLCRNIVMFYVTLYTSVRCTSPAAGAAAKTPPLQTPVGVGGESRGVDLYATDWKDASDIPQRDCGKKWMCEDFNYASGRGHYLDYSCACDDLCVLLRDCCPDFAAHLESSPPAASSSDAALAAGSDVGGSDGGGRGVLVDPAAALDMDGTAPRVPSEQHRSGSKSSSAAYDAKSQSGLSRGGGGRGESSARDPNDASVLSIRPNSNDDNNSNKAAALRDTTSKYSRYNLTVDMFSCVFDMGINIANNVSVVSRCPEGYADEEVVKLCHNVSKDDMMTHLPVSGTVTMVLYRNMFCALCHQEPFVYWTASVNCSSRQPLPYDENSTLTDLPLNTSKCDVYFQPPSDVYHWRPCKGDVTSSCDDSFPLDTLLNRQIAARCEDGDGSTQRLVFSFINAYRNQYCALCNHYNLSSLSCDPLSFETSVFSKGKRTQLPYSFSILLDINTNTGSTTVGRRFEHHTVERNESASCDVGYVFDPFRSTCRPVVCGPGRYFIDNACVQKEETYSAKSQKSAVFKGGSSRVTNRTLDDILLRMSDCTFIQLNDTEYQLSDNGTLELLGTDSSYNASQYVLNGSDVYLCVSYSQNYTRTVTTTVQDATFTFSLTEAVISTCGICVSLIALVVTIFVYASLRALRNIPGRNLLSLVCSLFLADVLLLVAPSTSKEFLVCTFLAGAMHYFFLASFVWMNVMALDVWFTFSKAFVKAGDRGKSSKRFLMYSAYAWLTPVAFVLPAALLQMLNPGSFLSPRYGSGICWLTNKYALLLFFAAPLFVLLLLNIVFFLISARNISRAKRSSARMLGKEEDSKMAIYVKLTFVMGITWILGFLAALVPNNPVLTYSFVVMNTLQGLFICLSFVFTKKVLHHLKAKFCGRKTFGVHKSGSTDMTNLSKSQSSNRKFSSASARISNAVV